ncbi:ester cyclase [Arthrobacter sp. NQ7]|uniref:ester cyclase n=1 Tax=Arthrobacter sp. NQ7 TaxID=3032303 RepID=UPI00240FDA53|nr:ester cyclase [Arthrobacter sp. NQ7]MDJ0459683.1 ester cyclase [Arthrobacter sp. NQ7]
MVGLAALGQDNAAAFRRLIVDGFQAGDPGVVDELVSPDLVEHQFGSESSGPAAVARLRQAIREVHAGMPDVRYSFDAVVADGDTIWTRMTARGTDTGGVLGRRPSGRKISITVVDIARFREGKLVEHWGVPDRFTLLTQAGHLGELLRPRATAER